MRKEEYTRLIGELGKKVTLVAVSKMQPVEAIKRMYDFGHRDFGENYVQELIEKQLLLPQDIRWHFIGHLQSNKIKYIAPFVHLMQSVDSFKLLLELDKEGNKAGRQIDCLLQVHVAMEDTKFGLFESELDELVEALQRASELGQLNHIRVVGLMGMASFSEDEHKIRAELKYLSSLYDKYSHIHTPIFQFKTLSMGMSGDYKTAIEEGSNMVRIGSLLFGSREPFPQNA